MELKQMQMKFKENMARLGEIRNLTKLDDGIRAERDRLLEDTEALTADITDRKSTRLNSSHYS